jgi:hypothetical protein
LAAPTNTLITNNAVGNRKSLHNIIYEEWQLDALGNADPTNAQLEGDDTTAAAITPTSRVGNRTQILKKPFTISATQEVVKKAGRDSEISYQTELAGRRIKMIWKPSLARTRPQVRSPAARRGRRRDQAPKGAGRLEDRVVEGSATGGDGALQGRPGGTIPRV